MKAADIAHLLPVVFQRTLRTQPDVLGAMLGVMDELHDPSEKVLAELDRYFLPDRTDDAFLPFLAQWVDLDWLVTENSLPNGDNLAASGPKWLVEPTRLRCLIQNAVSLHRQRGTRHVLIQFLQIATGAEDFAIWEDPHQPFHILVGYPGSVDLELVQRIVEWERPAYVTYELCQIWKDPSLPSHILVVCPKEADPARVKKIIEWKKPAGVTYDVCQFWKDPNQPSHILVVCPKDTDLEQVRKIVKREKPVGVTYDVCQIWVDPPQPFHILVVCLMDADLKRVERIVGWERPADVAYEVCQFRKDPNLPSHILVVCPKDADLERVRKIVEWKKPADVTYELYQGAQDMHAEKRGSR